MCSIQFSIYFLQLLVVIWIYHKVLSIFINQLCCVDLNSVPDNTRHCKVSQRRSHIDDVHKKLRPKQTKHTVLLQRRRASLLFYFTF